MTTDSGTHRHPPIPERILGPGELIAAIPAFLGFTPERSLVLMCLDVLAGSTLEVQTVMRHDLTLPDRSEGQSLFESGVTEDMQSVIEHFAEMCAQYQVRAALAVIVDDRGVTVDGRFRGLAHRLSDQLRVRGVELTEVYLIAEVTRGSRWRSAIGVMEYGYLTDPRTSPVALAYMLQGRGVHESRTMLARTVRPVDDPLSRTVARTLASGAVVDVGSDRGRLHSIVEQLEEWSGYSPDNPAVVTLPPERIAEFGAAVQHVMVRDSVLALALTGVAGLAEQLWTLLMRTLPAPERACPATLLAFSAYTRGEGALASVALDIAHQADENYSLAHLLSRSLAAGARPSMIREVALSGYAVAELCGVALPPPVD
ncbi:DUF4192 domain-containing protein [Rhodococcus sp. 114MFTsu3.1]|uniref:DUF4192 domain-containing protein n=1 Tax=Rhodococcus sp. 114MFTsu3.1 TaxID=1172184 RepID=UPI00035C5024|nr:DUF4192 domain-containing protein [Rhodococcus sp. 114MFTsu3.1]